MMADFLPNREFCKACAVLWYLLDAHVPVLGTLHASPVAAAEGLDAVLHLHQTTVLLILAHTHSNGPDM